MGNLRQLSSNCMVSISQISHISPEHWSFTLKYHSQIATFSSHHPLAPG
jgi:hypothetical protein